MHVCMHSLSGYRGVQVRGPEAVAEWKALQEFMRPYASAASALPPAALRGDAGAHHPHATVSRHGYSGWLAVI